MLPYIVGAVETQKQPAILPGARAITIDPRKTRCYNHIMNRRAYYIVAGMVSFAVASLGYLLYRPLTLRMFSWARSAGLMDAVLNMRKSAEPYRSALPGWAIYSAPFAVWMLSYMLFVEAVWNGKRCKARLLWILAVPALAIASELGQLFPIVPGAFDIVDLIALILGAAGGYLLSNIRKPAQKFA